MEGTPLRRIRGRHASGNTWLSTLPRRSGSRDSGSAARLNSLADTSQNIMNRAAADFKDPHEKCTQDGGPKGDGNGHLPSWAVLKPPEPPVILTPAIACDASTEPETLWKIALEQPSLRRWVIANPHADAALLEYIAQSGGPGVSQALEVFFEAEGL